MVNDKDDSGACKEEANKQQNRQERRFSTRSDGGKVRRSPEYVCVYAWTHRHNVKRPETIQSCSTIDNIWFAESLEEQKRLAWRSVLQERRILHAYWPKPERKFPFWLFCELTWRSKGCLTEVELPEEGWLSLDYVECDWVSIRLFVAVNFEIEISQRQSCNGLREIGVGGIRGENMEEDVKREEEEEASKKAS